MIISVSLIADAWHTLSDSFSSIVVIVGLKYASIPADKDHPFGHGRAEWVGSVIVGVLLILVGFNFLAESIKKFIEHEEAIFGTIAIVVTIFSAVSKEILAYFSIKTGKKTNSKSLIADGWHHRSDAITSVVILVGIFLGKFAWWIDSALGIIVTFFIFYTAYSILKESVSAILGESPDEGLIKKIKLIGKKIYNEDLKIHNIQVHNYGDHAEMILHICLPQTMTIQQSHEIATKLEDKIEDETEICATVHIDPK